MHQDEVSCGEQFFQFTKVIAFSELMRLLFPIFGDGDVLSMRLTLGIRNSSGPMRTYDCGSSVD